MFTQLKKGRWNFLFFAAVTTLVVAAMATLLSTRPVNENNNNRASHSNSEQVVNGRYTQYNETTLRFIN
jgi:hypothetical protein